MRINFNERSADSDRLRCVPVRDDGRDLGRDRADLSAVRAAFYRLLMCLDLRYTIYEGDVVVIERPQLPDIVVDLSTGRLEYAET